jgi:hypothetical protein
MQNNIREISSDSSHACFKYFCRNERRKQLSNDIPEFLVLVEEEEQDFLRLPGEVGDLGPGQLQRGVRHCGGGGERVVFSPEFS